ncbi:hypothetical protein QFC20_003159 [Naganishia adeliensis]|uniref:Uncharacterized protein n=1 Tax=Naganishia adeliensis TaxID=92952 RepID=A0ACC2WDX4_9TREE|nr:hypothetical protein QFC20_003159 [Naganishia adeliensis]
MSRSSDKLSIIRVAPPAPHLGPESDTETPASSTSEVSSSGGFSTENSVGLSSRSYRLLKAKVAYCGRARDALVASDPADPSRDSSQELVFMALLQLIFDQQRQLDTFRT